MRQAVAAGILIGLLTGCQSEMNSVRRSRWQIRMTHAEAEQAAFEKDLWRIQQRTKTLQSDIAEARTELARTRAAESVKAGELEAALRTLRSIEEDLQVARNRKKAIDAELADVRRLAAGVAKKEQTLADLAAKSGALDAELAGKRKELTDKQTAVAAQVAEIQGKLGPYLNAETSLRQALEAVQKLSAPDAKKPPKKSP